MVFPSKKFRSNLTIKMLNSSFTEKQERIRFIIFCARSWSLIVKAVNVVYCTTLKNKTNFPSIANKYSCLIWLMLKISGHYRKRSLCKFTCAKDFPCSRQRESNISMSFFEILLLFVELMVNMNVFCVRKRKFFFWIKTCGSGLSHVSTVITTNHTQVRTERSKNDHKNPELQNHIIHRS